MCLHLKKEIIREYYKIPIFIGFWTIYTEKKKCKKCNKILEIR